MTDAIIWAEKLPDIIKKWILVVPMLFAFFGSGIGIYQTYSKDAALKEAEEDKNRAVREVAIGFQATMAIPERTITPKIVVPEASCGECLKRVKKLEETQKRWH